MDPIKHKHTRTFFTAKNLINHKIKRTLNENRKTKKKINKKRIWTDSIEYLNRHLENALNHQNTFKNIIHFLVYESNERSFYSLFFSHEKHNTYFDRNAVIRERESLHQSQQQLFFQKWIYLIYYKHSRQNEDLFSEYRCQGRDLLINE